ncbi:hypothetical protein EUTSA_v10024893mg [Eutrema salsugineum]|uniref:TF-B3 domain-containing protein n=1 Tax=Eutrema salsugineum TaxID=72664 RepID=V4P3P1_EUTSA|nr:B3 domain-containing protein REM1 [Eutrema salsugineum]ESQ54031.1 hypothetical protein EUTSA_v10024893mg [Eutrema salsugineum]
MADPPNISLFHQRFLTGDNPLLTLDDEFLRHYTKVLLRSDASDRIWEVKLNGNRLAGGWEEFAAVHRFRDGDVLVFRHDKDENFHVSVGSRSDSCDMQHASPSIVDTDDTEIDDDYVESADHHDDGEDEDEDDAGDIVVSKNKKPEAESSSGDPCFITAHVTPYSLIKDRLDLSRNFTVASFDEDNKPCEIDLANEKGRKWTLLLRRNISTGVFYIRRGWTNFCSSNELRQGDLCKFKLSENGERPVLWLCPQEYGNGHEEQECPRVSAEGGCSKEKSMLDEIPKGKEKNTPSTFLKIKLTPNRFKSGQLYISSVFVNESGINNAGEITLLNKDGRKWSSYLHMTGKCGTEWFYLRKGWKEMCKANGVKVNDSFVLELIWEDANPTFKFYSKEENHENKGKGNRRTRKRRACGTDLQGSSEEKSRRVEREGRRVSRRAEHDEKEKRGNTQVSNRPTTNSSKLQRKQAKPCSVSDQVANVKRGILDTLKTVSQFRAELETREKKLEAALLEIEALGERILGISQILNNNLV